MVQFGSDAMTTMRQGMKNLGDATTAGYLRAKESMSGKRQESSENLHESERNDKDGPQPPMTI